MAGASSAELKSTLFARPFLRPVIFLPDKSVALLSVVVLDVQTNSPLLQCEFCTDFPLRFPENRCINYERW